MRRAQPRRVDVVGTGRASAVPDVVRLAVGVACNGDDVSGALRASATRVGAMGAAARAHGIPASDIRSVGAGVHPRYDEKGQRVVGFQAFHRLQVVVRAVDQVGAVVDALAVAAGDALSVDAITLELSDREPLEQQARERAFGNARAKAEQYAVLSGASLGPVLVVREGLTHGAPQPGMLMAAMARDSAMPVEAGEQSVTATVSVSWGLEPLEPPRDGS